MSVNNPDDLVEVYLEPGKTYFGKGSVRVRTILGSCVAITLWHPTLKIGGMCHFMLPERKTGLSTELDGHYANEALTILETEMTKKNSVITEYQAKIFGGGEMFGEFYAANSQSEALSIGKQNIQAANQLLAAKNVTVAKSHTGEGGHRKIIFEIWSGNVWLKHQRTGESNG